MQLSLEAQEEAVRPYAAAGLSTRKIADETGMSQSTVSRVLRRINTGPQPIIQADQRPRGPRSRSQIAAVAVLAIALLILAAAAASVAWARFMRGPAPVVRVPPAVVCIRSSAAGNVTGIALASRGKCAASWKTLTLTPGS